SHCGRCCCRYGRRDFLRLLSGAESGATGSDRGSTLRMTWETIFREVFRALVRNRIRSLLTMLGIIMGVGSFICVVGVGRAGSSRVEDQLSKNGDNLIWVEAGSRARSGVRIGTRGIKTLTTGDAQAVMQQVPGVKSASPNVDGHIQTVYGNMNWGTQYRGVS